MQRQKILTCLGTMKRPRSPLVVFPCYLVLGSMIGLSIGNGPGVSFANETTPPSLSPLERNADEVNEEDLTTLLVRGQIIDIQEKRLVIVESMDGQVELRLTPDTTFKSSIHIGDTIVASVSPQGKVRQITVVETNDKL